MVQVKGSSKILIGIIAVLLLLIVGAPNLLRSRYAASRADFMVSEDDARFGRDKEIGGGGGGARYRMASMAKRSESEIPERKIIRTASFDLIVDDVPGAKAAISKMAEAADGFVENSESTKTREGLQRAKLTIRVPQSRLDDVRDQIRKLAGRVEFDKSEARDVTREFVDSEARLRNLKAEETQYLGILKSARTVKDTVEVTEKLSDVRGEVEQLTGELKYLSQQVEMSVVEISLRTEADATQAEVKWRPWSKVKNSWRDLLQGLADFADMAIAVIVMLPLIILWIALIYGLGALVWKLSKRLRTRSKAQQSNPSPPAGA